MSRTRSYRPYDSVPRRFWELYRFRSYEPTPPRRTLPYARVPVSKVSLCRSVTTPHSENRYRTGSLEVLSLLCLGSSVLVTRYRTETGTSKETPSHVLVSSSLDSVTENPGHTSPVRVGQEDELRPRPQRLPRARAGALGLLFLVDGEGTTLRRPRKSPPFEVSTQVTEQVRGVRGKTPSERGRPTTPSDLIDRGLVSNLSSYL